MKASIYQEAIYNWVKTGVGDAVVEAVAGSGKTWTALEALKLIPPTKRTVFLAFNKSIADELKKKAPRHVDCLTLNSLGFRAWAKFMGGYSKVRLESGKNRLAMEETMDEFELRKYGASVKKLMSVAKSQGLVPDTVKHAVGLLPDTYEVWASLMAAYDIDIGGEDVTPEEEAVVIELTRKALTVSCQHPEVIDFDDQLYLTVIYGVPAPAYDWIFVDEAQDLSPVQHRLVESCRARGGRIVAIGDSRQAIYGFRGADAESMANFKERLGATTLDLSICYRCPTSHVAMAKTIVPQIEAAEGAIEGEVLYYDDKWDAKMFRNDDLIICRNNAPMVRAAYQILSQGVAVRIMGRDLGKGLTTLIQKLKAATVEDLVVSLNVWAERETTKMLKKDPDANLDKVTDRVQTIICFIDMFPDETPAGLCQKITDLYSDNTTGILTLATVHKAKGMEAERVYILNYDLLTGGRGAQSENLRYVALTRAKKTLGFIKVEA